MQDKKKHDFWMFLKTFFYVFLQINSSNIPQGDIDTNLKN